MAYRHDMLRHKRIAQHASMRREKSRVLEALVHSGHVEPSTSKAHASPHAFTSSSSRRRRVSPTDVSLPPSSRRNQVSPIQALEVPDPSVVPEAPPPTDTADVSELVPPHTAEAAELVPPPNGEDAEPEAFKGAPAKFSQLPLYPNHIARHIWDREVT